MTRPNSRHFRHVRRDSFSHAFMSHSIFRNLLLAGALLPLSMAAQNLTDSATLLFHQSKDNLDLEIPGNQKEISRIIDRIREIRNDSTFSINSLLFIGAASPEGAIDFNRGLSQRRANTLFSYIGNNSNLPDSIMKFSFLGRDWAGLAKLVANDTLVPFCSETSALVNEIAAADAAGIPQRIDPLRRLRRLRGGVPYRYLYRNLFPLLRASRLYLNYERKPEPEPVPPVVSIPVEEPVCEVPDTVVTPQEKPFYMAVKSNMLYDAILIPNIGVEFYLGKNFSVTANWMYAWWKCDHKHNYWRTYGGDIEGRWWFGTKAHEKPLTGHHIGVYAQMLTYDFELGGKGYLGPKWSYGGGVSYGYSLPVAKRINIDFTIGVGYLGENIRNMSLRTTTMYGRQPNSATGSDPRKPK